MNRACDIVERLGLAPHPERGWFVETYRAATTVTPHDHVIAASSHYLRSPHPGPVTVTAEVLRTGRSASQVRARMAQSDHPCAEALITVGQLNSNTNPHWDLGAPAIHFGVGTGELLADFAAAGADVVGVDCRVPID